MHHNRTGHSMRHNGALSLNGNTAESAAYTDGEKLDYFHLFWIFLVCSVCGLVIETIVSFPIDGIWKNRAGLVWGPFSPIYGAGGVLMTIALHNVRQRNLLLIFGVAAFTGATFEMAAGWFFKNAFGIVAWDYSDQPFNIGGYTCLGMAIVWGTIGLLWAKALLPFCISLINSIPQHMRKGLTVLLSVMLFADIVTTLISFDCWYQRLAGEPIVNSIQAYFAQAYSDVYMQDHFQTMSLFTDQAHR